MYTWPASMGESTRLCAMAAINLIADAADHGERCPTTPEFVRRGISNPPISQLARLGFVRSEVFGKNYRVVHILTGPHAGKSTRPPEDGGAPWLVIGGPGK
jgi:hypothetical protein